MGDVASTWEREIQYAGIDDGGDVAANATVASNTTMAAAAPRAVLRRLLNIAIGATS